MRGLSIDRARDCHGRLAFLQNLCRCHYELAIETLRRLRFAAAFAELASAV